MLQVHSPRVKDLPWVSHGFLFFFAIFFLPNGSCFQRFILRSGLISLSCAKCETKKLPIQLLTFGRLVKLTTCWPKVRSQVKLCFFVVVFFVFLLTTLRFCTPNLYVESRSRNRTETATKLDGPDVGSSIFGTHEAIEMRGIHDNLGKRKV